jgi:hypothetical protein
VGCESSCTIIYWSFLNFVVFPCNSLQSIVKDCGLNILFNRFCLSRNCCGLRYVINLSDAEDFGESSARKAELLLDKFLNGLINEAFFQLLLYKILYFSRPALRATPTG